MRKIGDNEVDYLTDVLHRRVYDRVGTSIVSVRCFELAVRRHRDTVVFDNQGDNGSTNVVHVENWRVRVQRNSMKLVRILHSDLCKDAKVLGLDGIADGSHAGRDNILDAMLEKF